jgi:hypothetical protein
MWLYHILFIYSPVDEHLGYFYLWVIVSNAAMNICVQVFAWAYTFISLGYIPESEIAGSYDNSM